MDGLFAQPDPVLAPPDTSTPGERRRRKQVEATRAGQHPLSVALRIHMPLHADAAPAEPRDAAGLRCGTCARRELIGHHTRSYPKCTAHAIERSRVVDGQTFTWHDYPRASHGGGTDVAAWFPACRDYTAKG